MNCPVCWSERIEIRYRYAERCPETGYDHSGEWYRCLECGARGDAEDLLVEPAPAEVAVPDAA